MNFKMKNFIINILLLNDIQNAKIII